MLYYNMRSREREREREREVPSTFKVLTKLRFLTDRKWMTTKVGDCALTEFQWDSDKENERICEVLKTTKTTWCDGHN